MEPYGVQEIGANKGFSSFFSKNIGSVSNEVGQNILLEFFENYSV